MGYKLKAGENLNKGFKRIASEQLEKAILQLEKSENYEHEAVHDVRKRMKKIRAVIRLLRSNFGKKLYQKENGFYRDVARKLSTIRDTTSTLQIAENVIKKYPDDIPEDQQHDLVALLKKRRNKLTLKYFNKNDVLREVKSHLIHHQDTIQEWPLALNSLDDVADNFKRVYKRGYKSFSAAYENPSAEAFHELRKRVKYLWYHFRILHPIWPNVMKGWKNELDEIGDIYGDDHDLAVLLELIKAPKGPFKGEYHYSVEEKINQYRYALEEQAYYRCLRVYYEKPGKMLERFSQYWHISEQEMDQKKELNLV